MSDFGDEGWAQRVVEHTDWLWGNEPPPVGDGELLRRADEFFDDLERGEDVLGDHLPVDELLARLDDLTS